MEIKDCFCVGFVTKIFGYKGELVIFLDVDNPEKYEEMESIFLLIDEKLVPFFIDNLVLRPNSSDAIVSLQDVCTAEKAKTLIGSEVFLPEHFLPQMEGDEFYFHEIEGYQAIDASMGPLGIIVAVLDFPGNPVIQIQVGLKELLIPAHDEFILHLDRKNKKLIIRNAEGLIDLYLNE